MHRVSGEGERATENSETEGREDIADFVASWLIKAVEEGEED